MILRKEDSKLYDKLAVAILTGSGTPVGNNIPNNIHKFIIKLIELKNEAIVQKSEDKIKTAVQ